MILGKKIKVFVLLALIIASPLITIRPAIAQDTLGFFDIPETYDQQRGRTVFIGLTAGYTVSMAGLYQMWYKDYPQSSFHFFNDNGEWLQVDKVGHTFSAYYLGTMGIGLMQWTGMEHKKAVWIGGTTGWVFLTTIEIFDGFSSQWGFSVGDMIANTAGTMLAIGQELHWKEQRIRMKFSYSETEYPQYRPDLLGESAVERLFKDYNGQTYWLSGNIHSFCNSETMIPPWLNIAIGYGAEGMTGANDNSDVVEFERRRQFYLSPDIDLRKIKTNKKGIKLALNILNFIKIPAPTLEYNSSGDMKFHWLYF